MADYWMSVDGVTHAFNGPGGCVMPHEKPCPWSVPPKVVERVVEKVVTKVVKDESSINAVEKIVALAKTALYAGAPMNPESVLAIAADWSK